MGPGVLALRRGLVVHRLSTRLGAARRIAVRYPIGSRPISWPVCPSSQTTARVSIGATRSPGWVSTSISWTATGTPPALARGGGPIGRAPRERPDAQRTAIRSTPRSIAAARACSSCARERYFDTAAFGERTRFAPAGVRARPLRHEPRPTRASARPVAPHDSRPPARPARGWTAHRAPSAGAARAGEPAAAGWKARLLARHLRERGRYQARAVLAQSRSVREQPGERRSARAVLGLFAPVRPARLAGRGRARCDMGPASASPACRSSVSGCCRRRSPAGSP